MSEKPPKTLYNEPDPARLISGLRDTGYSSYSAIADILDNSISADANEIRVQVSLQSDGRKFVYIGDNGHGVNQDQLLEAMKYGSPKRETKKSLGKFGLGLKTASSSVCRKYSLISKAHPENPLSKLSWDLDHVEDIGEWEMLEEAITEDEQEMFTELCGDIGTLVVWQICDRLLSKEYAEQGGTLEKQAITRFCTKLKEHCALVFHKFSDSSYEDFPNVGIWVNDSKVEPWNPFYPDKSTRTISDDQTQYPVNGIDGELLDNIHIQGWVLPHKVDLQNDEEKELAKISNARQGFYIYIEKVA
jgi:hypothetical protein